MSQQDNCFDSAVLTRRCEEAHQAIQNVLDTPPRDRHQIVDFGECALVALRDCLIALLREERPNRTEEKQQELRAALEKVNLALSLIVSVEYPGTGIQQQSLEQARQVLEGLTL